MAIRAVNLSKVYRIYDDPYDRVLDKVRWQAVTMEPAEMNIPMGNRNRLFIPNGPCSAAVPSGLRHRIFWEARSTTAISPKGGRMHGAKVSERNGNE